MGFVKKIAQNLRKPSSGLYGSFVRRMLSKNKIMETASVDLLQIKQHENVLEVGFGPGHGLNYVLGDGLREGSGKLYGVDFSEAMCDHVINQFKRDISTGKLTILNEDVAELSLPDSMFDKVFHTNCYWFWPDSLASCKELFRVMKPNSKMVTVMHFGRINAAKRRGFLQQATNTTADPYIDALVKAGFTQIENRTFTSGWLKHQLNAVTCVKS